MSSNRPHYPNNTTANRDDECHWCGYPFDTGDRCIDITNGALGILACGSRCADALVRQEQQRTEAFARHPHA